MEPSVPQPGAKASEFPRLPIGSRGFLLFLERPDVEPARTPKGQTWPGITSPFARWLASQGFRVIRLTDYTVEIGAGEGRAYCQSRYRLPVWAQRFHRQLRAAAPDGSRDVGVERCLEIARHVAPRHAHYETGLQAAERRRRDSVDRAVDHLPLGPRADQLRARARHDADRLW